MPLKEPEMVSPGFRNHITSKEALKATVAGTLVGLGFSALPEGFLLLAIGGGIAGWDSAEIRRRQKNTDSANWLFSKPRTERKQKSEKRG